MKEEEKKGAKEGEKENAGRGGGNKRERIRQEGSNMVLLTVFLHFLHVVISI